MLQMFLVYLNEGLKVLFEMGYTFFKFYKTELIEAKTVEQAKKRISEHSAQLEKSEKTVLRSVNFKTLTNNP